MQGIFVCLIAAWLLLLVSLLCACVRIEAGLRAGPRGGGGFVSVRWLLLFIRVPLRLNLLRRPYLTLELLRADGRVRAAIPLSGGKAAGFPPIPPPERAEVRVELGIADAPAATALLAGACQAALRAALNALLPAGWPERVDAAAEPAFGTDALFFALSGIIELPLAQIIQIAIHSKRGG